MTKVKEAPQPTAAEKKQAAVAAAIEGIEKKHGKGSVIRMGDRPHEKTSVIPTGSISLDHALGVGGIPYGRVIEIFGQEASGKTTLALHLAAGAQKQGGLVAFIDAEHALDPGYAETLGVNVDEMLLSQPDNGEQAIDIAESLIRSGGVALIIVDSVAALVPTAELEGEITDAQPGLQARLMSKALRKLTGLVSQTGTCLLFINQLREKINFQGFGDPSITSGGKALKFYASVRISIKRIATLKEENKPIGNRTKATVVKNKMAPPYKEAEFEIYYGRGISYYHDLLDTALREDLLTRTGAFYSYDSFNLGQGRGNAASGLALLQTNQGDAFAKLLAELNEKLFGEGN